MPLSLRLRAKVVAAIHGLFNIIWSLSHADLGPVFDDFEHKSTSENSVCQPLQAEKPSVVIETAVVGPLRRIYSAASARVRRPAATSRWKNFSFRRLRFIPSRQPFRLTAPLSVSVKRTLQKRKGLVRGIILHFLLFTRMPMASKRRTTSRA